MWQHHYSKILKTQKSSNIGETEYSTSTQLNTI